MGARREPAQAQSAQGTLRLLLLDEANRLDRENSGVLFDLCRSLNLQLPGRGTRSGSVRGQHDLPPGARLGRQGGREGAGHRKTHGGRRSRVMWEQDQNRLAVLELLHSDQLRRRANQREAWEWLSQLRWTSPTGRRDELALVTSFRSEVKDMLDRRWPEWRDARARLVEAELPVTHEGWKTLQDTERASRIAPLPSRLNRKTAAAMLVLTPSRSH